MKVTKKDLGKKQLELTIEVDLPDFEKQLQKAAERLSQKNSIEGFRPGKAPFEVIRHRLGEMAIYQEALPEIVESSYAQVVQQEKLETVSQPEVSIVKLAPGNPVVYTAKVALLPEVKVGDWRSVKSEKPTVVVTDEDVEKVIKDLASMQASETLVERAAQENDKVIVDFEISIDKVLIEGGSGKSYPLVIGSQVMVPGFEDQLIGLKAGEQKKFSLKFPADYFQTSLANKQAEFNVSLKTVLERHLPELDDSFAQKFQSPSLTSLKAQIKDNLRLERQEKINNDWERDTLRAIVAKSDFSDLPEVLVKNEINKMIQELRHGIETKGLAWANYLQNIKKTENDIALDFSAQAVERLKVGLVLRQLAIDNQVKAEEAEVDKELADLREIYKEDQRAMQDLNSAHYRQHLSNVLVNKKVIKLIERALLGSGSK